MFMSRPRTPLRLRVDKANAQRYDETGQLRMKARAAFPPGSYSMRLIVWVMGGAFLLATNYCICEVFTNHTHADASHQHAADGHHHDEGSPTSNTQYDPCCATLQALVPIRSAGHLIDVSDQTVRTAALPVVHFAHVADLSKAPSGLSPPAREPTTTRPFYRTTYANHAPPVYLA